MFFKGCPLACAWCHNPEGIGFGPQLMASPSGCKRCGACAAACPLPDASSCTGQAVALPGIPAGCTLCGACIRACPPGLRRIAGEELGAKELAARLLRNADYLRSNGGGFTLSGGEPSAQGDFALELLGRLRGNHRAMETSGFCGGELFLELVNELELIIMDIKIADPGLHRKWTGQDNAPALASLERLRGSGKPFIIRVPLIPGVSDTEKNLKELAALVCGTAGGRGRPEKVELLPYHKTAGAKYGMLGLEYRPGFDTEQIPRGEINYFTDRGIPCSVL